MVIQESGADSMPPLIRFPSWLLLSGTDDYKYWYWRVYTCVHVCTCTVSTFQCGITLGKLSATCNLISSNTTSIQVSRAGRSIWTQLPTRMDQLDSIPP